MPPGTAVPPASARKIYMLKTNKKKMGSIPIPKIKQGEWVLHVTERTLLPLVNAIADERERSTLTAHQI